VASDELVKASQGGLLRLCLSTRKSIYTNVFSLFVGYFFFDYCGTIVFALNSAQFVASSATVVMRKLTLRQNWGC